MLPAAKSTLEKMSMGIFCDFVAAGVHSQLFVGFLGIDTLNISFSVN